MSRAILITGASSGFGRNVAETLGRTGYTVHTTRSPPKQNKAVENEGTLAGRQSYRISTAGTMRFRRRIGRKAATCVAVAYP